jgi:isoleucyl-tRNA synthetase
MSKEQPVFERVPSQVVAPEAEERILEFWEREHIFAKSIDGRPSDRRFVFYEGPPTANGLPGLHHVLARVVKDLICRYKTMKGCQVIRKAGWDTHGLPVEIEVEKRLNIGSKEEIERYGVGAFNAKCRDSVFTYADEWVKLTRRIGFWLDLDNPYVTCTNDYIESIWHILKKMFDAGLIYKGHKVLPYCARCGTPLSSHEVSQGYADKEDPSIYVRMPLRSDPGTSLLVWTTTPWTLISNIAIAVDPDLVYLKVKYNDEYLIVARERADAALGEGYRIVEEMKGADLEGMEYVPPFDYVRPEGGRAHVVTTADFVTADDGTGLVHTAPAFGEDDYNLGRAKGFAFVNPVTDEGTFEESVEPWKGQFVIDANQSIIEDLDRRGILLRAETVVHTYPFCWRCDAPLIYYAHPSWYIKTTAFKDEMIEINKTINWHPKEFGYNRFGQWLENNVDWALSRERYWGTPLNIWICGACGSLRSIGSIAELRERARAIEGEVDLHKPWIDGIEIECGECGGVMKRTPEVIDCWFDTGGMPYAQYHWPFENRELFETQFPAEFICEGIDQTRGWFYSLVAISTFMSHQPSFKNVMVCELVVDESGQKMSKSRGNVVDSWALMAKTGADPLRWYLYAASPIGVPKRFSEDQVVEVARKLLGTLRNVHSFFTLYANIDCFDPREHGIAVGKRTVMDRWLISRMNSLIATVDRELEEYETTRAARAIQYFVVEELSNWYVRRSRRRYWRKDMDDDKRAAYATLYEVLVSLSKLVAPFMPFVSDEMYRHLVLPVDKGAPESVHLALYPESDAALVDEDLEKAMDAMVKCVSLVRAARNRTRIKVKQPLSEVKLSLGDKVDEGLFGSLIDHLKEEVNIKQVVLEDGLSEYVTYEVLPRFDLLGPRLGDRVKALAAALKSLDAAEIAKLEKGGGITVELGGEEIELQAGEVNVRKTEREGVAFETDGLNSIVLDLTITPELLAEGYAREIVSKIQNLRKQSGFDVTDKIRIYISGGEHTANALGLYADHIKSETLAESLEREIPAGAEPLKVRIGEEAASVVLEKV